MWDERNDQRWIDPSAEPAPSVSRTLYQLYWTIPVRPPIGHRALMQLDAALSRLCRNACFRAWKEEWEFPPLAEWTQYRIHDVGGWTGTGSRFAAMRRIGTQNWWRSLVGRFVTKERLVPSKELRPAVREMQRGAAMLRGFQIAGSQIRELCDLQFPKPFQIGWDHDRFSVLQMQACGTSDRERHVFAKQAEESWKLTKITFTEAARTVGLHARNRFTREGLLPSVEQIRARMHPPPDELNPPRRGFEREARQPSTPPEREPSVRPEDIRHGTGKVGKPERQGWLSGAHGHYGREVAPRDWWLRNPPLSLEQRASLVAKEKRLGGMGWTIWVCFGCARPCKSCHKRAGQHCAKDCADRRNRCARDNDRAILEWLPSEECWKWPFTDWPTANALPDQFWDERWYAYLVPPAFLRDMSEQADFTLRQFQPPWVLHIKGGRGPHGIVPCLEHDGRIAYKTENEYVAYCVSQNDLANGGSRSRGLNEYEKAPPWENRFKWEGEFFTQDKCLCLGRDNKASLCRNQCCCSYWLCDGWIRDHDGNITGRCWSAARHRSFGREIYY